MKYIYAYLILLFFIVISCKRNNISHDENTSSYISIKNESFSLNEIKNFEGVFLIISTTCSSCYPFFEYANELSTISKETNIKYIAILVDPLTSLEEYKKGIMYKTFGFLNDNWTVIPSKELPSLINTDYDFEKHGTPYIFYIKNNEIIDLNDENELSKKIETLTIKQ